MVNKFSIVIVDDEWSIRSNLSELFPWEELGFSIKGLFENGLKALSFISAVQVDVLLTDIRMPIMDGLELTRRIRAFNQDISIILLSAYEDFKYAQRAIEYGVCDYLIKPVSYNDIIECFSSLRAKLIEQNTKSKQELTKDSFYKYARKNIASFSIENAAKEFGISPRKIKEIIASEYNMKVQELITEIRMQMAKDMLSITGTRIFEIAKALGYNNSNNFTRAFLYYYGISPTDYRKGYEIIHSRR